MQMQKIAKKLNKTVLKSKVHIKLKHSKCERIVFLDDTTVILNKIHA